MVPTLNAESGKSRMPSRARPQTSSGQPIPATVNPTAPPMAHRPVRGSRVNAPTPVRP